jgi:TPP-dependent pyruvate/acetoin dehydrogenase alpha subunit
MSIHKTAATSGNERKHALALLRQMLLIRRFEEKAAELYSAGKIRGFLHLYIGEEAIAVGAMPLSGDHRATDGHRGALFLAAVDRLLQQPEGL